MAGYFRLALDDKRMAADVCLVRDEWVIHLKMVFAEIVSESSQTDTRLIDSQRIQTAEALKGNL